MGLVASFALGNFYFGYAIAYFSAIDFNTLKDIFNIDWQEDVAKGLLTGCIPIGGGIGALGSNLLLKRLTRRYLLIYYLEKCYWQSMDLLLFLAC